MESAGRVLQTPSWVSAPPLVTNLCSVPLGAIESLQHGSSALLFHCNMQSGLETTWNVCLSSVLLDTLLGSNL